MAALERYARITTHMPREFLLLQATGCVWRRCAFCDYHTDVSADPFAVNRPVIDRIDGTLGTVDVINSGSVFELDPCTLAYLRARLRAVGVRTLWCETHWLYHDRLDEIRRYFAGLTVRFRVGVETFDPLLRERWRKGIPAWVTPRDLARDFDGACLLVCVKGQTREGILSDIETAIRLFSYCSVNVFVENSTSLSRDPALVDWFVAEVAPRLAPLDRVEVLIENTDLGVG